MTVWTDFQGLFESLSEKMPLQRHHLLLRSIKPSCRYIKKTTPDLDTQSFVIILLISKFGLIF